MRGYRDAARQHPPDRPRLPRNPEDQHTAAPLQHRRGRRHPVSQGYDRGEVHQRHTDGHVLLRGRAGDQAGVRIRRPLVPEKGHAAGCGGIRRGAGAGADLHRHQPRHRSLQRLGHTHGHRHRLRGVHHIDAGRQSAAVAEGLPHGAGRDRRPDSDTRGDTLLRRRSEARAHGCLAGRDRLRVHDAEARREAYVPLHALHPDRLDPLLLQRYPRHYVGLRRRSTTNRSTTTSATGSSPGSTSSERSATSLSRTPRSAAACASSKPWRTGQWT